MEGFSVGHSVVVSVHRGLGYYLHVLNKIFFWIELIAIVILIVILIKKKRY